MKYYSLLLTAFTVWCTALTAQAQLNPAGASYFQNQYLGNASYAGLRDGLTINGGIRKLWSSIPGSPVQQYLTADYAIPNKQAGVGLLFTTEKTGLIRSTRMLASYAYHLPLGSDEKRLNFGLSAGLQNENIDLSEIEGDPDDVQGIRYNDRKAYFDGDFGISYTSEKLSLQASLPNLKSFFNKDLNEEADRGTFMTAVSYKWRSGDDPKLSGAWSVEPKVVLRGIKGMDNIIDAGAQLNVIGEKLNLMYMYHSTRNSTFGFGMDYKSRFQVLGMYTTNNSAMRNYVNESFEIGLKVSLL
jgi:type IX secretion system PorP/SprF family membrane protein